MANKDSVIFYQRQIKICKKYLTNEQFGRLMMALFALDDGEDPDVDDDIALAFEFMSLQQRIDKDKYEKICEKNRENAKKGGAPKGNQNARKQPKQPNGFQNNPNDNDKRMIRENNVNDNDNFHDSVFHLGSFENVELTEAEYFALKSTYERTDELIDKVSIWIRGAKSEVPDHYGLCVKFAANDKWPRRKEYVPPELPKVEDPLSDEEQAELTAQMKQKLGGMFNA